MIKIILMWYGFVIVWILPVYYKILRSRVMFERILWNIYMIFNYFKIIISLNFLGLFNMLVRYLIVIHKFFISLQLIKNENIFESKIINQKYFYLNNKENFENKIINQKFFYINNNINMNISDLFIINLFKRSSGLWGFGKNKGKIIGTICSSSPTVLKKKMIKKSNYNFNNSNNIANNNPNIFILNKNKQIYKNYSLEYKIKTLTKNHPKITEITIDNNVDYSLVIGNLTTSNKNATLIASSGLFYKDEVYVYNEIIIEKLDNQKLNELKEIIKINIDINYTYKLKNSLTSLNKLNNFIENKTKQKIFLKNEQIDIEGKIERIERYFDELDRINSRED